MKTIFFILISILILIMIPVTGMSFEISATPDNFYWHAGAIQINVIRLNPLDFPIVTGDTFEVTLDGITLEGNLLVSPTGITPSLNSINVLLGNAYYSPLTSRMIPGIKKLKIIRKKLPRVESTPVDVTFKGYELTCSPEIVNGFSSDFILTITNGTNIRTGDRLLFQFGPDEIIPIGEGVVSPNWIQVTSAPPVYKQSFTFKNVSLPNRGTNLIYCINKDNLNRFSIASVQSLKMEYTVSPMIQDYKDVSIYEIPKVKFSVPMDSSSFQVPNAVKLTVQNIPVHIDIFYDSTEKTLFLKPVEPLKYNTSYTVQVNNTVKNENGFALGKNINYTFQTIPTENPTITEFLNYPNPITSTYTYFSYYLSHDYQNAYIKIYSKQGKLVKTITDIPTVRGYHDQKVLWDLTDNFGDILPNGIYHTRLTGIHSTGVITASQKLLIRK